MAVILQKTFYLCILRNEKSFMLIHTSQKFAVEDPIKTRMSCQ